MIEKIVLARHQGFCMGVERAIKIADETAETRSSEGPVTILNEIVHNEAVVEGFRNRGVGQATSVNDVDSGLLIISAHGVSPSVVEAAASKGLEVIDATCPLVTRIYRIIKRAIDNGLHIIHYGDPHHDETAGVIGHAPDRITVAANHEELIALPNWKDRKLGLTVQTTAHARQFEEVERLARSKWPHIEVFNTICNATTERQDAIMEMAPIVDIILVVGSQTSANSKRMASISADACGRGLLIESARDIKPEWFGPETGTVKVGVSAGASTPQFLVDEVVSRLVELADQSIDIVHLKDTELPKRTKAKAG